MSFFMNAVANPFMKMILRSPFHSLMSGNTAVVSVTGRNSGRVYSIPVNYQREGDIVWITSMRDRSWWKNLRGGVKVLIRLAGSDFDGMGEVIESPQEVQGYLKEYLLLNPAYAKYLDVGLDSEGNLEQENLAKAAEKRVMVRVTLS